MKAKDFTPAAARDVSDMIIRCEQLAIVYADRLNISNKLHHPKPYYQFVDKDNPNNISFVIHFPASAATGPPYYTITYAPRAPDDLNVQHSSGISSFVWDSFNVWIALVMQYDDIPWSLADKIAQQNAREFFHDMGGDEPDLNTEPLSTKQQFLMFHLLDAIEDTVKSHQEDPEMYVEVTAAVAELKSTIHVSPKTTVMEKLAKIKARLFKNGPVIGKEILKKIGDKIADKVLDGTFDVLGKMFKGFVEWYIQK